MAVCVSNESPSQPEDSRVSGERTFGQLRELPIIAGWKIDLDFTYLLFDDMVIIHQPLSGRRDCATLVKRFGNYPIRIEEGGCIMAKPADEGSSPDRGWRNFLSDGKAFRVLLQPLGTKQLFPDWGIVLPGRRVFSASAQ